MMRTCKASRKLASQVLKACSAVNLTNPLFRSQKTKIFHQHECRYSTHKPEESIASNNAGTLTFETLKNLSQVPRPLQIVHLLQQDLPYLIRANAPEEHVKFALERLVEIDCATIYSYTMVISYLAKRNRADLAWKYWTLLKDQKALYPNEKTYLAILSSVCRSGELDKAELLLREALQRKNVRNKTQLYKMILLEYFFYNRGLNASEISKAEKLFSESLTLETDNFNKLDMFDVMAKLYAKNGMTKKIVQLLSEFTKQNIQPTINFMNSLMEVYLHDNNMTDAMQIFSSFDRFALTPNAITYSCLLLNLLKHSKANNYAADKEHDEKIEKIFKIMCTTIKDTQISKSAYTDMIQYYFMKDMPEKGNQVFELMQSNGISDVIAYNVMIDYYREVDINYAFKLFEEMMAKNIQPNMVTYLLLIDYYCKINQIDDAFRLLKEAKKRNLHPNVATYTTLIDYLGKTGRYDRIEILLREMIEVGVLPNEHTFAVLVNNLLRAKHFGKAYAFVKEMKKFGLQPNTRVYATLFDGILTNVEAASAHADSFIKLVRGNNDAYPIDAAVKYYAERRRKARVLALWKMLDEHGIELKDETEQWLREWLDRDDVELEPKKESETSDEEEFLRAVPVPHFR